MADITFHKLSWTDLQRDCIELYRTKLQPIQDIDQIVSICRGGDVVSRIFSDLLGTLPISHITLTSYHDLKKQKVPIITEEPSKNLSQKTILIIDEVSDTGETFKIVTDYFVTRKVKKIYTLSPYIKPETTFIPDFYQREIDGWIVFPYDLRETAEGFVKMFGGVTPARREMEKLGFSPEEIAGAFASRPNGG